MKNLKNVKFGMLFAALALTAVSCKKDEPEMMDTPPPAMMSSTFDYEFNNGQVVSSAAYNGSHMDNLTAKLMVEELATGGSKVTLTLMNTVSGAMYHAHAHDAADPATTPNGTPYNETPNSGLFTVMVNGNGGTVSVSQETTMTYSEIVNNYNGFLVVHDPLQAISTTDISTYLVVGTFARTQAASNLSAMSFPYAFNTGQVSASFAYNGMHANTLNGNLKIQQLADGSSRVSVILNETLNGEMYHVHAHDAADPATTPNNTPYNETPNSGLCTMMIMGNGGMAGGSQMTSMSYADITMQYEGFFVVHDPLQAISTTDPTTYVLLGLFARM